MGRLSLEVNLQVLLTAVRTNSEMQLTPLPDLSSVVAIDLLPQLAFQAVNEGRCRSLQVCLFIYQQ